MPILPKLTITYLKQSTDWDKHRTIRRFIRTNLQTVWPQLSNANANLLIVLSDDAAVHTLNKTHRAKDKPTNILSYADPTGDYVGQLILAHQTVYAESVDYGIPFRQHVLHLALHGTLHVLGYDHDTPKNAQKMEKLEIKLLESLGQPNPYQDTHGVA